MSTEADPNNAGEQTSSPKKKSKPNTTPKPDDEAIEERRNAAITWVPADAQNHPQLYKNVVAHIKKITTQRRFAETSLYKGFMGWSEFAKANDRPKLDYMIATLAVFDSFEGRQRQFQLEIDSRGLREWVDKKLEVPAQTATPSKPTAPQAQQPAPQSQSQTPNIKTEPGAQNANINTIRQSIEGDNGSTLPTGFKRPAPNESSEPTNKRANFGTSQALGTPKSTVPMLQLPPQQPIIYREAGVQTDQSLAVAEVRESVEKATARMETQIQEQVQAMAGNMERLNELVGRATVASARPNVYAAHQALQIQAEPQEFIPVQYISRQQGSSSFYGRGQDPGPSGGFLGYR